MKAALSLLAAALLSACSAEPAPLITVSEARAIALPTSAAVYFTMNNSGGRDRLLSVDAKEAGKASLHETSMDGGIMRMRAIDGGIEIPDRGTVRLSAGGRHVMIQDLAKPLAEGPSIRLTLHFERQGKVEISAQAGGPR